MSALTLAAEAARRAGLDPSGARVVRRAAAVIVDLPQARAVARVEQDPALARRQRVVGRYLAAQPDAPTMRLRDPADSPDASPVTLWERLQPGPEPDLETLGRMASALHALTPADPTGLPEMDPVSEIADWFERLPEWLPEADRSTLWERFEGLRRSWAWARREDPLGWRLIHGDVHPQNVLWRGERAIFTDLESTGMGPASWDLMPHAVYVRRYGLPLSDYHAFLRAYGVDPADWSPMKPKWPGFLALCELYELLCVIWTVGTSDADAARLREAHLRLDGWLRGGQAPWTLS